MSVYLRGKAGETSPRRGRLRWCVTVEKETVALRYEEATTGD